MEDNKDDGSIPFLDTIVKPEADGTLSITVYRKPTHTDQYLQWDSHHHLSAKFSVIHTLSHRAKQCAASLSCSNRKRTTSGRLSPNANILNGLWTRWRKDLTGLPVRSLMGLTTKALQLPKLSPMKLKIRVTLSYPTHKVFVKVSRGSAVDMAFKPTSKVARQSRTSPKGKDPMVNQSGAIYWYQCGDLGCDYEYIGETFRTVDERYKEHLKAPSAIHHHSSQT